MLNIEAVKYYISNIKRGIRSDDACHGLLEIGEPAVDPIMAEIQPMDLTVHTEVFIELLGQIRCTRTLPLLVKLVLDSDDSVWKAAMRAIVVIGGEEATLLLGSISGEIPEENPIKQDWFREALVQIARI